MKSGKKLILKNFSILSISNFLNQIIGLVVLLKLAKIFDPDNYGTFTFMLIQCQMLVSIADLGLRNILIRKIARNPNYSSSLFITSLKLKIIFSFILLLIYFVYNSIFSSLSSLQFILIFILLFINCSNNLFESLYWGYQKMTITSVLNITFSILWVSFIYIMPEKLIDIALLFIALIVFSALKLFMYFYYTFRFKILKGKSRSFKSESITLMNESWPYFSLVLLMVPSNYLAINFLELNSDKDELGFFNLSYKILAPILVIINLSMSAIFPNLSILYKKNKDIFLETIKNGFNGFIFFVLICCSLTGVFMEQLILIFLPLKYVPGIKVAQILIWYILLMSLNTFIGTIWGASDKEKLIFKSSVVNMIIATPILYQSSFYGALGLSYGYLISFSIFQLYIWYAFLYSMNFKLKDFYFPLTIIPVTFVMNFYFLNNSDLKFKLVVMIIYIILFVYYLLNSKFFKMIRS